MCSDGSDETGFEFGAGLSAGRGRRGIDKKRTCIHTRPNAVLATFHPDTASFQ